MVRIMLSVLQFRVNARYVEAQPPFISIEMDHSDSGGRGGAGRGGGAVQSITPLAPSWNMWLDLPLRLHASVLLFCYPPFYPTSLGLRVW